jgi:hypothetical protein
MLKFAFLDLNVLRRAREMESVQELYDLTISHLPSEEQIQLASLILEKVVEAQSEPTRKQERLSVLEILKDWPGQRLFKTSAEADAYLREERDSWDH